MQNFRNLNVWKKSHALALAVHRLAPHLRVREAWPLKDQMFRASISIPSNIAEGAGRGSDPDFRLTGAARSVGLRRSGIGSHLERDELSHRKPSMR